MGIKVLIVEDEFLIRLILADALSDAGYDVEQAATGDEAASVMHGAEPLSLLVTDIQMPGTLDGGGLARFLRQSYPNLPVVYTSGRPDNKGVLGPLGRNNVFIRKPYTPSQVVEAIGCLLNNEPWSGREDSNLRP